MAQVTLEIGGRRYEMTVRDGQEAHFRDLAAIVDAKVRSVAGAVGTINESRQLLMASLLLADEIGAPAATPAPPTAPAESDEAIRDAARQIDRLADQLEKLAQQLENGAQAT